MQHFQTADLCDEYPASPSCLTDFKIFGRRTRFYGKTRTVRCYSDNVLIRQFVNSPGHGEVLVVDGQGALFTALLGDRLARTAMQNGWAGIIIYGAIRDSVAINKMEFGIKASGTSPKKSAKNGTGEKDVPVSFGEVTFIPYEYVYSDEDGIIVSKTPLL